MNRIKSFGFKSLLALPLLVGTSVAMAADPTTLSELAAIAATEMGPVKGALLAIGAILLGIAALLFGIYKVVSMANGRK